MRHRLPVSLFILTCSGFSVVSAQTSTPAAVPPEATPAPVFEYKPFAGPLDLQDGDTLVFLGDSITHQCLYTQYVEDYFYTRYPRRRLHFHNAGVGGDRARDAIVRFDEDVAAYRPKVVTILLGMNDGQYRDFDAGIFSTYQRDMAEVLDRIGQLGALAVPITPTMFDGRSKRLLGTPQEPRDTFYNGVLALYGAWLREQAEGRGLGFVDMWSPLNQLMTEVRKTQPKFTLIKDGIHPEPAGQVVMAAAWVGDLVKGSEGSRITLRVSDGKVMAEGAGGLLSDAALEGGKLSFDFVAEALPWILPPAADEGVRLTKLSDRFTPQTLVARGLAAASYELKIDGASLGTFSAAQLADGLPLHRNPAAPDYQQALNVALVNLQRNRDAIHPLRDQYSKLKGKRRDLTQAQRANDPQLETKKADFAIWQGQQQAAVATLLGKAQWFEDQIYATNQPQKRRYELTPVP